VEGVVTSSAIRPPAAERRPRFGRNDAIQPLWIGGRLVGAAFDDYTLAQSVILDRSPFDWFAADGGELRCS
jgi:hypothetical protein